MDRAALLALLEKYLPSDAREEDFRGRMLTLTHAPEAFSRRLFTPGHFTASAFVLSPEADALLLIHHRKLLLWLQPGGHVEPEDASLLDAARREAQEEVGLSSLDLLDEGGPFDVDVHAIPARKDEPAHEHFDVRYAFRAPSRELRVSDEVAGARWVPLGELTSATTDESVLRAVRKLRGRLGM